MKLYLSSYRLGNDTSVLKDWLLTHDNNILVIPNALDVFPDGERKSNSIEDKNKDLVELGFVPKILDLRNYFSKPEDLKNDIKDYKAFFVQGGNTFTLRRAMKLSGFDNYLKSISEKPDYLYSGFSAGICVLAKDLHGLDLVDDPNIDPYDYGKIIWDGVGLIDFVPVPHFDTPSHPESRFMNDVVKYLGEHHVYYKTLKDGDVIVEDINDRGLCL